MSTSTSPTSTFTTFLSSPSDPPVFLINSTRSNNAFNTKKDSSPTSRTSTNSSIHTSRTSGFYSNEDIPPYGVPLEDLGRLRDRGSMLQRQQLPLNLGDIKPKIFVTSRTAALVKNSHKNSKILQRKTKTTSLDLTAKFSTHPEDFYANFYMPKSATFERLATTREEETSDEEVLEDEARSDRKSCTSVPTTSGGLEGYHKVKRVSSGAASARLFGRGGGGEENGHGSGPMEMFRSFFGIKK